MAAHKSKKHKSSHKDREDDGYVDTSKPSAVFVPTTGRSHTLSIALPGSIIANAVTPEQKTALAGQIARACAVYCVDEIIVFNDGQALIRAPESDGYTAFADPNHFLFHVLSFLETPPHLRRALFPIHPDLKLAGALPSLDMPHHLRSDEWCAYREAVAVRQTELASEGSGTLLDCGLADRVFVTVPLDALTRVTVKLGEQQPGRKSNQPLVCEAVSPDAPREEAGYYWGYSVRQASSLGAVFTEAPYDGGYSVSLGTSERGVPVQSIVDAKSEDYLTPTWNHLLIVLGGVAGLEAALSADKDLQRAGVTQAKDLFDAWVNLVPAQGSRTIRTEEALWIALANTRRLVESRNAGA